MMSGLALEAARVAVGRLALRVRTFCICRLTIMNEASRKNMMSIKGMISRRAFFRRMGERIFMDGPAPPRSPGP